MTSLTRLVGEARAFVESSGDARTNARTTINVAVQAMSKEVEALKTASKAFANATSQFPTALKAAHEMTEPELKDLKKLIERLDTAKEKLKKYVLWADENTKAAGALYTELGKPGPSSRIGAEPDPDKPFDPDDLTALVKSGHLPSGKAKPVSVPKPNFSASEWQLYTSNPLLKAASKKAAVSLNAAAAKALDYLEVELPKADGDKEAINKVLWTSYKRFVSPALSKYSKSGAADTEPHNFIVQKLSDWTRLILKDSSLTFYDVW
jgi:hypothetical protein